MTDGVGVSRWSACTLAECGEWVSGGTPRKSERSYWGGDVPWISAKSAKVFDLCDSDDRLTAVGAATTKVVPKGTVLFVVRGMSLAREFRVGVAMRPLTLNQDLRAIIPSQHIDSRYLARFLRYSEPTILGKVEDSSHGTKRLPTDSIQALQVQLPPLSEQHRIAAILDKADAIRRKRRDAECLSEQFLRSAFLYLFGDPIGNTKGWGVKRLRDVATVDRGKFTPRPRTDPKYYGGEHPFIQTGALSGCRGILSTWSQTLNDLGTSVSREFPKGTVAIAIAANIGDTVILGFDSYFPDSVVGIVVNRRKGTPEYLEFWLRFQQALLKARAPETAQKNINLETLRPMRVPIPPIGAQQKFARIYRRSCDAIERYERATAKQDELFAALAQRAFRGELTSAATVGTEAVCGGSATDAERTKAQQRQSRSRAKAKTSTKAKRKEPKGINFKRGAIASYVIARLHSKPTFGRTQLEKLCYLTQTHLGIDLAMEFKREAAGPFDEVIHKVESLARKQGWFTAHKRKDFGHHYRPGPKINSRVGAAVAILGDQRDSMDSLLDLFARMKTEQAELFATVYAAWNDLLLAGTKSTDADITSEVRDNWHESKQRFTIDRIQTCIDWIRQQNLTPTGTGIRTEAC